MEGRLDEDSGKVRLHGDDNSTEGQFFCDQCDKVFAKHSSLARHKYEHSGMVGFIQILGLVKK